VRFPKINDSFLEQTRQLVDEGARIDIVGCQMHIFNTNDCMRLVSGATDVNWVGTPQIIRDRLDRMARTGRPIHVSEVTIAAPGEDRKSRERQAVLVRNIYRVWFSHPATMGITWWNTVDGAGVAGEPLVSGLYTVDMRRKPAYAALEQLINHEWRTLLDVTAKDGKAAFRGFRGRYRLTWKDGDGRDRSTCVELK
jgi:GH35 family endo-1,4-beta-xylanase